jgi:GTPase
MNNKYCVGLQIKRSQIRKGMVMASPKLNPQACWEFEGEILVLHHPTTIAVKYQAMGKFWVLYLGIK